MSEEVFPFPTVKEVAFELKFPHLFSIENKIGDFQDKIIKDFPNSAKILQREIVFADTGLSGKFEDVQQKIGPSSVSKIWQFESKDGIQVKVQTNALNISSTKHKTYNNATSETKFRDVINFVTSNFLGTIKFPIVNRIGLRYIDECPLPSRDNATIKKLYNLTFPIERFPINDVEFIHFKINTLRSGHKLNYNEVLGKQNEEYKLILDFDGYENEIPSTDFLRIADELHSIISKEYFKVIKEPIKEYMRVGKLP